jgi:hypothetical protein
MEGSMFRLLVTGDRNWEDYFTIRDTLAEKVKKQGPFILIEGGCRGADNLANMAAKALGLVVKTFKADWKKYGKAAGPIRNQQMLDEGKPEFALAFHNDLENSRGTKDMVSRLEKAGVPYEIVKSV